MQDLHNSITTLSALESQTIATDTTTAGNIIDRANYEAVEFVIFTATVTDGDYAVLIEDGDAANLSDAAAVPDTMLLGTEAGASVAAADDDQAALKIGYVGGKRYVRLSLVSTSTTVGGVMGSVCILGHPAHRDEPV